MPRPSSFTSDELAERALQRFWLHGYYATSMDDLVRSTGVSRQGIYSTFGGKKGLFLACFVRYQELVVSPAFEVVESPNAGLSSFAAYFDFQISRAEKAGLPGPGCFVANSTTELAHHDTDVMKAVSQHTNRLVAGFSSALRNARSKSCTLADKEIDDLSRAILCFANGLWALSRGVNDAKNLREPVRVFLDLIAEKIE